MSQANIQKKTKALPLPGQDDVEVKTRGNPRCGILGINPKFGSKFVARYEKTEFYKPEDRNITFLGFAERAKFTIIANFSYLF
jgi:hypothetical protein